MGSSRALTSILITVLILAAAVGAAFGAHTLIGTPEAAAPDDGDGGNAADSPYCLSLQSVVSREARFQDALDSLTNSVTVAPSAEPDPAASADPALTALQESGQTVIDASDEIVALLRQAATQTDNSTVAAALATFADAQQALGNAFGEAALNATSVETFPDDFSAVLTDPTLSTATADATTALAIIDEDAQSVCGFTISDDGGSGGGGDDASAAAQALAVSLGSQFDTEFANGETDPVVNADGTGYSVNGTIVSGPVDGVALTNQFANGPDDWCVEVTVTQTAEVWSYSAASGLIAGACVA